jgi:hypothetical protein
VGISSLKTAFVAGEFDPKLLRPDMEQYAYGADKVRNAYLQPQGGFFRAPGWDFHHALQSYDVIDRITQTMFRWIPLSYIPASSSDVLVVGITARNGTEFYTTLEPELDYTVATIGGSGKIVLNTSAQLDADFPGISSTGADGTAEFYVVDLTSTDDAPDTESVKVVEFNFSLDQKYAMVYLPFMVQIFRKVAEDWTLQATVNHPAPSEVISKLTFTQQLDSQLIFAHQIPTQHLQRKGSHTDWVIEDWDYQNIANKTFFDTPQSGKFLLTNDYSWIKGYYGGAAHQWDNEISHQENLALYNFTSNDTMSMYVDGVETAAIVHKTTSTSATSHTVVLTTTGLTGDFIIQLRRDNADWVATSTIDRDATDATAATNIQTALNAHSYVTSGVTVAVSAPNQFTITFAGAAAGFLWSMRVFYEDENTPIVRGGVTDYLNITQIGYPVANETQVNITEAIYALDNVTSPPLVVKTSGLVYTIVMLGEGDDQKKWFFLQGSATKWSSPENYMTFVTLVKGKPATEASFSTRGYYPRGFPRCGVFFQGRLWVAGSTELPQFLFGSRINNYSDFDATEVLDGYGIEVEGDTNSVAAFFQMKVGRHLQLFSDDAEFYVPVDATRQAITPTNVSLRRTTNKGTIEGLNIAESDGATIFLQRDGKALLEFIYTDGEEAYTIHNLGAFVPHLLTSPTDMTYQVSRDITVTNLLYVTLASGDLLVFHYLKDGNVRGWVQRSTEGGFQAIEKVGDDVVAITSRNINSGGAKLFLEEQNFESHVDCGKIENGVSVSSVSSGISHLNGEAVDIMVDGAYYGREVVTGGTVNFVDNEGNARTVTSYEIGLPFPVVDGGDSQVWVRTLPYHREDIRGTSMGSKVKVMRVDASVVDSQNLRVRHDFDKIYPARNQITQFDFVGFSDGDTYQITINGENTGVITYSTTPATNDTNITNALEAMSQFSSGDVSVAPLAGASDQMVLTFQGDASAKPHQLTPSTVTGSGVLYFTDQVGGAEAIRPRDNTVLFIDDKSDAFDSTGKKYTGELRVEGFLGYSKRGQVSFTQNLPGDLNVTNVIMHMRT